MNNENMLYGWSQNTHIYFVHQMNTKPVSTADYRLNKRIWSARL